MATAMTTVQPQPQPPTGAGKRTVYYPVWCISLADREDRYQTAVSEFRRVNLGGIRFLRPAKHDTCGEVGCWLSHAECMREIVMSGAKYGLIFEDDVDLGDKQEFQTELAKVEEFLNDSTDEWDIVRLGGLVFSFNKPSQFDSGIWEARSNANHAYFISAAYVGRLMAQHNFDPYTFRGGIDDYFRTQDCRDFITTRYQCHQRPQPALETDQRSDNKWYARDFGFQAVVEHPWVFKPMQRLTNWIAWKVRWLPSKIQPLLNPFPLAVLCMARYNDMTTEKLKNIPVY